MNDQNKKKISMCIAKLLVKLCGLTRKMNPAHPIERNFSFILF